MINLIIGGYAVELHGFLRFTGDIDFFVAVNAENAAELMRVFDAFRFGEIGISHEDFMQPNFVVEIGREPRKIQVLTGIDGVTFADCHSHRVKVELQGIHLKFIGKEDLIRNKQASARSKDLIDVDELSKQPRFIMTGTFYFSPSGRAMLPCSAESSPQEPKRAGCPRSLYKAAASSSPITNNQ